MSKWPTVKHFTCWLGFMSQLAKDGRQGEIEPRAARQEPGGVGAALGRVEPHAEPELPRGLPSPAAVAARHTEAITATAHKLARIVYHLIRYGMAYVRQTEEVYAAQVRDRLEKQLHRRAKELGYTLRKIE